MRIDSIKKIENALKFIIELEQKNEYTLIHFDLNNITYEHIECGQSFTTSLTYFMKNPYCGKGQCKEKKKRENPKYKEMIKARSDKSHETRKLRGNPGYDKCKQTWAEKDKITLFEIAQKKHENKINSIDENGLNAYERATIAVKKSKLENYGNENYNNSEKRIETCNDKYGMGSNGEAISEGLLNKSKEEWDETIQKRQDTNIKLYGSVNAYNDKKVRETNQKNLGVDYPSQNIIIKEKVRQTFYNTYYEKLTTLTDIKPLFTLEEYKGTDELYKFLCLACNQEFSFVLGSGKTPQCTHCYPPHLNISKIENEIKDWLTSLNISISPNERFYYNKQKFYELDIYIPEKNIGIELNGVYYHSEISGHKNKYYHIDKTNFFKEKNIQVMHIWDREWIENQEIIQSLILAKINIFTNTIDSDFCDVIEIDNQTAINFLNQNHIQSGIEADIHIGLLFENNLVQVLSFINNKNTYEIFRFSLLLNTQIIGGFSKCIKYFTQKYSSSIVASVDKRFSTGKIYLENSFKLSHETEPNYQHIKNYVTFFSQEQYNNLEPNSISQTSKWDILWDCGNYVFEYEP